jgi:ketosteroid isomerase-like protein
MEKLIAMFLVVSIGPGYVSAAPPQASKDTAEINAITKLENDMGDAMIRVDLDKLNQIYGDDFATLGSSGKVITKKDLLHNFESLRDQLVSFENGPMDVQVFGNVAVVHAGVTEKRVRDGKDASGDFVWMDLLEKRGGKWVVVRSAGSRLK